MVEDTNAVAEIQHNLSCTLQNYLLSDQFPSKRQRISFHVSQGWYFDIWAKIRFID